MQREEDTICAIASGLGSAAIGIIRVSGRDAIKTVDKIFVTPSKKRVADMKSFTAAYGYIVDPEGESAGTSENKNAVTSKNFGSLKKIDEVIVLVMKAPSTYTTEDCVEIDCHGGSFVMKKIVDLLAKMGIRPADPGEFTKRAFLGGRIDMTEAEAVMDVINAENDMALSTSLSQLSGKLKDKITAMRETILHETAFIEAALDDPEHYSLDGYTYKLESAVKEIRGKIKSLADSFDDGRMIREGIRTAIVGRPNVGKSSVLNMMLGQERAIVTDVAGTTRDTLEEYMNLGNTMLKLIDTAGIRNTEDTVEKIGVKKAEETIERADLILFIIDGTEALTEYDREIAARLTHKTVICLINKMDKGNVVTEDDVKNILMDNRKEESEKVSIISISAHNKTGLDELKNNIEEMFFSGKVSYNDQIYITNSRQKACLIRADEALERVQDTIAEGMEEDLYTIDLLDAYESLGNIIGETLEDDLADKIFKDFCMGK